MFLDISFIGAASYRKDGYAKIYNSLRKHRRRSICVEDSSAQQLISARDSADSHSIKQRCNLNTSLQVLKHERKVDCVKYRKCLNVDQFKKNMCKYDQNYNAKILSRYCSHSSPASCLNRVSFWGLIF